MKPQCMVTHAFTTFVAALLVHIGNAGTVTADPAKGPGWQAAPDDYSNAFSDPLLEQHGTGASADGPTGNADEALSPLAMQTSFPLRLHVGGSADKGWPESTALNQTPQPVSRHYRLKDCEFDLRTGEFGVRQYQRTGEGLYIVLADALQKFSTIPATPKDKLYLSVTTELVAVTASKGSLSCVKAFSNGKKMPLGRASLAKSSLTLKRPGGDVATRMATPGDAVPVFAAWDKDRKAVAIVDGVGMPPALESGIFVIGPVAAGDYYLALSPAVNLNKDAAPASH